MKKINLILLSTILFGLLSCQEQANSEIKWNFKKFHKLTYDYSQVMENQSPFGMDKKVFNEAKGTLIVSVKDNGKANIVFKEVKMSMFSISDEGDTNRMMTQTAPDFFMQDMDEFGNIEGRLNQQTELLAQVLFPIPTEKISVGDISKLPTSMPFNMFGSQINVTGFNEIKLESIENNIASISTVIDVSDYDIPEDANVNYDCFMKGTSNYTFDTSKGYFKTANLDIVMAAKSVSKEDEEESDDNSESNDMSKKMSKGFGMEMKTNIKLELLEIE